MDEIVDIFAKDGTKTGERLLKEDAIKQGKLIKAFQIWILNDTNQVLIEVRSTGKLHDAGMFDLCSGHVQSGEEELTAVKREVIEELGANVIKNEEFSKVLKVDSIFCDFRKYSRDGNYIIPWYILKLNRTIPNQDFNLQVEEVSEVKWIDYEKVKEMIKNPNENFRIPYNENQMKEIMPKIDKLVYERK